MLRLDQPLPRDGEAVTPRAFEGGVLSCEDAVSVGSMLGVELSFVVGRRGTFGRIGTESSHYKMVDVIFALSYGHYCENRGQKNQDPHLCGTSNAKGRTAP